MCISGILAFKMDILSDTSILSLWLTKYGSFVLFIMLSLGIIALPIPEETLMVIAGVLMHKGRLNIPLTVLFAYAGTIAGITTSYFLGRTVGNFFIHKYGVWVGITHERLEKAHYWFERLGKWLLLIGYFIPGIRHLTGFTAGATYMKFSHFALFAYTGAILWVSLFLSLGFFVGTYCLSLYDKLEDIDLITIALIIVAIFVLIYIIKKRIRKAR
jgi:membrane protein DedA with SNARE-associated domain